MSGSATRWPYKTVSPVWSSNIFVATARVGSERREGSTPDRAARIEKGPKRHGAVPESHRTASRAAVAAVAATSVDAVLYAASIGTIWVRWPCRM